MTPLEMLRHHVTGAIERGEGEAIVGRPVWTNPPGFCPFCGSALGLRDMQITWLAQSSEEPTCEPDALNEWQCHDDACEGRSFFI